MSMLPESKTGSPLCSRIILLRLLYTSLSPCHIILRGLKQSVNKKKKEKTTYFLKKGTSCIKPASIGSKSLQGVTAQKGLELLVCVGLASARSINTSSLLITYFATNYLILCFFVRLLVEPYTSLCQSQTSGLRRYYLIFLWWRGRRWSDQSSPA
jgi:hypothetical protein